jgi:RNA polymerase sigma-70 factor (ECF subfamily)
VTRESEWLAGSFEENRIRLRAVAYRLLGSLDEADDALQEAWIRATRADASHVENLGAWLTTIVARIALNMLRARSRRREESLGLSLPDPVIGQDAGEQPEEQAMLADSIGLALLVVLESLGPDERLAFVLHDVFQLPFEDIAPMIERTPEAARQMASRARRKVQSAESAPPERDRSRQRAVVDAFFTASREGNFEALLQVLHPDVILRADFGPRHPQHSTVIRGAKAVIESALTGAALPGSEVIPAMVNGSAGAIITMGGRPFAILGFVISAGRIVEIDGIADPPRVARLAATVLAERRDRRI